jgi:hypothetical protein
MTPFIVAGVELTTRPIRTASAPFGGIAASATDRDIGASTALRPIPSVANSGAVFTLGTPGLGRDAHGLGRPKMTTLGMGLTANSGTWQRPGKFTV